MRKVFKAIATVTSAPHFGNFIVRNVQLNLTNGKLANDFYSMFKNFMAIKLFYYIKVTKTEYLYSCNQMWSFFLITIF
jgi:hypothetical protein